ncbi:hypothetical protein TRP8649_02660 [Pelagimonas phthalicica]|uniref:Uncharacterized protein n=1 Tax=Pelagimonas phthalicica TaxID=1037362 RepID=A0A238JDN4_9RHOB|nr:hypothetical protein [Pelagimonas phthalicica]TDS91486.1 hypothetical protein CLV87_2661 [Pelagimonas phthalicica]SMX28535.1 hypothetical protein TRP8649_02660 [Pelagimonas phthalicica]
MADCNSSETVEIKGVPDPDAPVEVLGGELVTEVQNLYAPVGALSLNRITSLSEAIEVSKSAGYQYSTNAAEEMNAMAKRNRVDLMCGCKLHYPDSRGAAS